MLRFYKYIIVHSYPEKFQVKKVDWFGLGKKYPTLWDADKNSKTYNEEYKFKHYKNALIAKKRLDRDGIEVDLDDPDPEITIKESALVAMVLNARVVPWPNKKLSPEEVSTKIGDWHECNE